MTAVNEVITMHEAKSNLSSLVKAVKETGRPIIIGAHGKAEVMIVPMTTKPVKKIGVMKGRIEIIGDIEEPLPDELIASFEGTDR